MRTFARRLGNSLAVAGVLLVVYAAMVVFWRDPVTSIYTAYEQHEMSSQLSDTFVTSRIGLSTIVVENTDYWGSLSKGPGRYEEGSFPGLGQTTGIAGHRTTFAAPFRHINSIRNGDPVVLQMPYGTFTYRVLRHQIVDNGDWSIMRKVGFDELVLSACHPLYSASHRYVIFARLESVKLPGARDAVRIVPASSATAAA